MLAKPYSIFNTKEIKMSRKFLEGFTATDKEYIGKKLEATGEITDLEFVEEKIELKGAVVEPEVIMSETEMAVDTTDSKNNIVVANIKFTNSELKNLGLGETVLDILTNYISRTAGPANIMHTNIVPGTTIFPVIKGMSKGKKIAAAYEAIGLYMVSLVGKTKEHRYFHFLLRNGVKQSIMVKNTDCEGRYISLNESLKYVFKYIVNISK